MTLFRYAAPLRPLILRAKTKGDHQAMYLVSHLANDCPEATTLAQWSTEIIPAPSSLWGRIRGRFDMAHGIATSLAHHHGRPMASAPASLYWRVRKHAQMSRDLRLTKATTPLAKGLARMSRKSRPPHADSTAVRRILVVDDIVTTGVTMAQVREELGDRAINEVRFMALADASTQ